MDVIAVENNWAIVLIPAAHLLGCKVLRYYYLTAMLFDLNGAIP